MDELLKQGAKKIPTLAGLISFLTITRHYIKIGRFNLSEVYLFDAKRTRLTLKQKHTLFIWKKK